MTELFDPKWASLVFASVSPSLYTKTRRVGVLAPVTSSHVRSDSLVAARCRFDYRERIVDSIDYISPTKWAVLIVMPPLIDPSFVAGWSYL